jgi:hypothetical protein
VAVKVIEHDTSAAAAVTNEIQLLLSFNHPNIVSVLPAWASNCKVVQQQQQQQ